MKAAPFAYVRPATLREAADELAASDGGGKVLAGGQSLTPVLAMRLARPDVLIDINSIGELGHITRTNGWLEIGATVRQRRMERDQRAADVPLLGRTMPWIGHRELRSRGTVCGSLAHADPAAELPAVACCLGAELIAVSSRGERSLPARDFFSGAMITALEPDEMVRAVRLPVAGPHEGFGFGEIARRHGDFALAGVVTRVARTPDGLQAVLSAFGVSDRPVTRTVHTELTAAVAATDGDDRALATELTTTLAPITTDMVDTDGDAHASADYRRQLLHTLAVRELTKAHRRATTNTDEVPYEH